MRFLRLGFPFFDHFYCQTYKSNDKVLSVMIQALVANNIEETPFSEKWVARFCRDGGGIFTKSTMRKLLGIQKIAEKGKTKDNFWYDQRNKIKRTLIDLELFISVAGEKNVDQVINEETMTPLVNTILAFRFPNSNEGYERVKPDPKMAKVAKLFIETGFSYLAYANGIEMTRSHNRTVEDAMDLAKYLESKTARPI